jgi:pimeloyl-ACP methyl ester carboxylesterase
VAATLEASLTHRTFDVGGVHLHAVEAGHGPLVILLHGFPDFWYGWRHTIGALVDAGFRVVAPDMRGYNLSEKPAGFWSYRLDALAKDVAGLVKACGAETCQLVGHDWGGVVAWHAARTYPELINRVAILNAPAPPAFWPSLPPIDQLRRSWFMGAFQMPGLPELAFTLDDFRMLREGLKAGVRRPGALTDEDLVQYVEAFQQPGALSAAIDYYRALPWFAPAELRQATTRFERPVLVIWGHNDPYLLPATGRMDYAKVPAGRFELVEEAGHWVHWDQPERVNRLLATFLMS